MKKVLALFLVLVFAFSFTACNREEGEKIRNDQTQIYVDNYNGGVGQEWLTAIKSRFERDYSEYQGVNGKKGVQVVIGQPHKNTGDQIINTIKDSDNEIYFSEGMPYYNLVANGLALDISDVVTGNNFDGKTILSKLDPEQVSYLNRNGKYYGIPHYATYSGINYNVALWEDEDNSLYLNDEGGFITDGGSTTKSNGPDGQFGTYDDGLPATFDEFFKVCKQIVDLGYIPFTWSGQYGKAYMNGLLSGIFVNYEGKEQTKINFSFRGTAKNLITVDSTDKITPKGDTVITPNNGYEMYSTAGRYYSLKFLERIFAGDGEGNDYFDKTNCVDNTNDSHTDAQTRYILSCYDTTKTPIAMFIDGNYWENEAAGVGVFDILQNVYSTSRSDVKYGFMPMPYPTTDKIGSKPVLMERSNSLMFINSNVQEKCPEKIELLKEFVKYCNTDESLQEFTLKTNTTKALKYSMTDSQKTQLSYYCKTVVDMVERADFVYQYSQEPLFMVYESEFSLSRGYLTNQYAYAYDSISQGNKAYSYFNSIWDYRSTSWSEKYSLYFD